MNRKKPSPQPRERLVEVRNQRELSQKEVAERLGTSDVNVSRWERGITRPTPYFRRKLSHLFGKTEEELALTQDTEERHGAQLTGKAEQEAATLGATSREATSSTQAIYDPSIPLLPPVHLVGREGELGELRQRLRAGDSVAMIALHGLPGVGKTALASALVHDSFIRSHFSDGILWAGLGPAPDVSSILSHWSLLLGVATPDMTGESDHEALALQLRRAIGTRRMLLVIGDAWELEDALLFKVGGPDCAHLVTTRFPGIASAFAPNATSVIRELGKDESMVLLRMLAPQVVERETQKAQELALAVGGLPLALTLLGNYLRLQSYSGQARRIDAALARLSDAEARLHIGEPRGPAERHTSLGKDMALSLQSVIDVTCQQLQPQEKTVLCALSVFPPKPGHFSEDAALSVANCNVAMLDTLFDTGLLESTDANHYRLHQTIADYARAALGDDPTPHERLIAYATDLVEKHRKDYEILEPEYDSIIAALESAHALGMTEQMMRCVYAFIPYLRSRGLYELAEKQLQRALEGATSLRDDDGKSHALLYLGEIAQKRGNYEQANTYLQEGLNLARQIENPERISAVLADLGWITSKRGEYSRAETYLQEGLILARQINNAELICDIVETLGIVAASRGEYGKSKVYMEEALTLAREIDGREKVCTLLINLGETAVEQGNNVLAMGYFEEGLVIARQLGHREWICLLISNLGGVESEQHHYETARLYFDEGLSLARQMAHFELMSSLLINLALISQKQGYSTKAEEYLREGLSIARSISIPPLVCEALYEYGNLQLEQNRLKEAEHSFQSMLVAVPEGNQDLVALALYGFARTALLQGDVKKASELGKESAATLDTIGHHAAAEVHGWLVSLSV